ncbi:MAG: hypothetical protein CL840_09580 [Crocinitomicaceae bacterium]|nr:hypothetical protein [Crocinitomicaceae bacterium]
MVAFPFNGKSTHIVGGEMYYEYLGNGDYKISLVVYRDCFNGIPPFDSPANISIYSAGKLYKLLHLYPLTVTNIPSDIYDSCYSVPSGVCVERGYYETTISLPKNRFGYTISWQRCCRNNSIRNIITPKDWGSTITTNIPSRDSVANNSSPVFKNRPPLAICLGSDFKFDNSAIDLDGDSLVYELCDVLHGGGTNTFGSGINSPKPDTPSAPPYTKVIWGTGFTTINPIAASIPFTINDSSGLLKGTPNQLGQYVFGVCVSEYRNGKFVGMTRREYQVNVKACISRTVASLFAPSKCNGLDLTFTNNSKRANTFLWDFGVSGTSLDTSTLFTGHYVFPDSGTYNIRLIANPGWGCADTFTKEITIYHSLEADIQNIPGKCISDPVFDFYAAGKFQNYTDIKWTFGGASPDSSNIKNPKDITFSDTGRYKITLRMEHKGCTSSVTKYAIVYPNLEPNFFIRNNRGCTPLQVQLEDRSKAWTDVQTIWKVDNRTYYDSIERFTFTEPGEYIIEHIAYTTDGCKDTLPSQFKIIDVYSGPIAGFDISENKVSIFNAEVSVIDKSYNRGNCLLYFGDEKLTADCNSKHTFSKPGKFKVSQIVKNSNGCIDTASTYVEVENEFAFFIPSTFTPNRDGLNEVYKPILIGVKEIEFTIYDRWGAVVFHTTDLNGGWDGRKKDKGDAPIGTYVYKIRAKDFLNEFHFYSNNVYLVR